MSTDRIAGSVKWYDPDKGYGFIIPDNGDDDVFLHKSEVPAGVDLTDGDKVTFELTPGKKGKGYKASNLLVS